jgi:hypothetical protein
VESENTIPVFEWAKTFHALDRAATVIGIPKLLQINDHITSRMCKYKQSFDGMCKCEYRLKKHLNSVASSPQANYTDRATAACRLS